jgi:NH3-dependent NAD+ synthetase
MTPLGDLPKTKVWELAEEVGVFEEIINRVPSGILSVVKLIGLKKGSRH